MRVIRFEDRDEFARRVTPFLMAHEAENCFFLGHVGGPDLKPEILKIVLEDADGEVAGVGLKWPDRHIVLSDAPAGGIDALVDYLIDARIPVQGAQSHSHVAQHFIERYAARTGAKPASRTAMGLHALAEVNAVRGVAGALRMAKEADVEMVADWIAAFCRECHVPPPKDGDRKRAMQRIEREETFFWEVNHVPVSTASLNGPTPNGVRISLVYTPPELRGHGYASACVAALSQRMLDSGKRFCFLYTDMANPTSNKIYRAIGYQPVCDNLQVLFEGASGGH